MTDPSPEEFPHEQLEKARAAAEKLEDAARQIGLYLKITDYGIVEGEDGSPQVAIIANFLIGDLAWSDRVQDPAAEADMDQVAAMETALMREKAQELRDRMRRKREGESDEEPRQ